MCCRVLPFNIKVVALMLLNVAVTPMGHRTIELSVAAILIIGNFNNMNIIIYQMKYK